MVQQLKLEGCQNMWYCTTKSTLPTIVHIRFCNVRFQHEIKKVRNSLLKSQASGNKRLEHHGRPIRWENWIAAYDWDCSTNPVRVHHRLVRECLYPNGAEKMRNKLAVYALNADMLHLMQVCYHIIIPRIKLRYRQCICACNSSFL